MYFLAVETSCRSGSLALAQLTNKSLQCLSTKKWTRAKDVKNKKVFSHAEFITTEFQSLLDLHQLGLKDINAILITHGPGSFTGIRVGLSFVKTLAYSLDIPIYSTDTLISQAYEFKNQYENLHVISNAQKNLVFYSSFKVQDSKLVSIESPQLRALDRIPVVEDHFYVGDGVESHPDLNPTQRESTYPKAQTLIELFNDQPEFFQKNQWNSLKPLYLKASEAEENLKKGLLKPIN